jgi:hypothetical protein
MLRNDLPVLPNRPIPQFAAALPDSQIVARLTKQLHANRLIHSCMTCIHFAEHGVGQTVPPETCVLYNQRPPARVIAYGCLSWLDDDLPF